MKRLPKRLKSYIDDLQKQRWFQQKEAQIKKITPFDYIKLDDQYGLGIFEVSFKETASELYLIPTKKGGFQLDVVAEKPFLKTLFTTIENGQEIKTEKGRAVFEKFGDWHINTNNGGTYKLMDVSSSNTLVSYSETKPIYILKMLRRILPGDNVEANVGRFLSKSTPFKNLPQIRSSLAYVSDAGRGYHLATVFQFVESEGDGWLWTLGELEYTIDKFIKENVKPTEESVGLGMEYYNNMMYRLGKVLADLHLAMASGAPGTKFEMLPILPEDTDSWRKNLIAQAERTFGMMEKFSGDINELIITLSRKNDVITLFNNSPEFLSKLGYKIRQHADFHLGQVLVSNDDFFIIDFEGEPLKPYDQRAAHYPALKDVAGMCRSFNYASFAAYLAYRDNYNVTDINTLGQIQEICRCWELMARRSFLDGYFQQACNAKAKFLPVLDKDLFRKCLNLLELEKALYEAEYEINNRPDWLPIPIGGINNCLRRLL